MRRPAGRKDNDKVHDSIIEERIQRERPCRILFIRNIKYETNSADVRRQFEEFGDIKTFFDLISTRGMVFVTYFDLRAAERARERMQGAVISGRPIDVHYSLPRDDHGKGNDEKNNQMQGTLQVTLRNSISGQPIDDSEVRRKFQQFGDVKSVRPVNDRQDSRYVEFYDTRACDDAFDSLRHQSLQDGIMDISFAWDNSETNAPPQRSNERDEESFRGHRGGGGRGRGGGNRGRGRGRGGHDDDYERRTGPGDYRGGGKGGGRFDGDRRGGWSDRFDNYNRDSYSNNSGPPPAPSYPPPPPAIPSAPPSDDRLEQARKVQQLLAALKQPSINPPAPNVPPIPPPANPYYPPASYAAPPPPASNIYAAPPPVGMAGLPPNILTLMQASGNPQNPGQTPLPTAVPPYGVPAQPPPAAGNYEQLMSFLHQKPS